MHTCQRWLAVLPPGQHRPAPHRLLALSLSLIRCPPLQAYTLLGMACSRIDIKVYVSMLLRVRRGDGPTGGPGDATWLAPRWTGLLQHCLACVVGVCTSLEGVVQPPCAGAARRGWWACMLPPLQSAGRYRQAGCGPALLLQAGADPSLCHPKTGLTPAAEAASIGGRQAATAAPVQCALLLLLLGSSNPRSAVLYTLAMTVPLRLVLVLCLSEVPPS